MLKKKISKRGIHKPQKAVFDLFHVATMSHRTKTIPPSVKIPLCHEFKDTSFKSRLMKSFNGHFNIRMKTWHRLYPAVTVGSLLGKLKKHKTKLNKQWYNKTFIHQNTQRLKHCIRINRWQDTVEPSGTFHKL